MSYQRIRHFALALAVGLIPLLPATPVSATSTPPHAAPTGATQLSAARIAQIRDTGPPVMRQAADHVATAAPGKFTTSSIPRGPAPLAVSNPRLYREVFGFAFAQSIGDPTVGWPSWNMGLLSTVAYFGVHVDWTGALVNDSGLTIWDDPNGPLPGLINAAHSAGTKVVFTIIMGDSTPDQRNICSALDRWQTTVQSTVAEVTSKGVDGVNIDYEGSNVTCNDPGFPQVSSQSLFTSFVAHMRSALPSGSYLSVDTYSGSAGYRNGSTYLGFFDIGALANYVDSFFVMAYDMEYENAFQPPLNCTVYCLGPTAPLTTYYWNDTRASNEYSAVVAPSKVIMGIPYYGRKECVSGYTPSNAPPNALRAAGTGWVAEGYLDASTENGFSLNSDYHTHREVHDTQGNTEWDTWTSSQAGCTREMYYDDVTSLGNKYDLVINNHLRGIGIFALSYGGGAPELWSLINLKFGQCSQGAISADHASPQIPATAVTFTGSALCAGTATYRFWMQSPGATSFTQVRDYTTAPTWTWDTTSKALGTYTFEVDARNQGASISADTYARMSFRLALCAAPALTPSPGSPQLPGTAVALTTSVTCSSTPEYQFSEQAPGGAWTVVQPYGAVSTFNWDTRQAAYGSYSFTVSARNAGTTIASESTQTITYALQSCISSLLTTDKLSPQPTGSQITLSGSATCAGSPQYRFLIQAPGGAWTTVQDFGGASTFKWSAGGPDGVYNLEFDAKQSTAALSTMSSARVSYGLTACTGATIIPSPASPQKPGTTIVLTGAATCDGTPQYRFWVHKPDGTVGVVQTWSGANTYSWDTSGLPYGQYGVRVDVRNTGATIATYETVAMQDFMLQAPACTVPTASTQVVSPQGPGAGVNITAGTTTCPQPVYQFWMLPPGSSTWTLVQPYSTNPTFHWITTGAPAGSYQFSVWVRDASRPGIELAASNLGNLDAYLLVPFTYAPCTSAGILSAPAATAPAGTTVTLTGTAGGCSSPVYEFWILAPGSTWKLLQAYSTSATFNWSASGSAGTYYLGVWVRDSSSPGPQVGSGGAFDANGSIPFTVTPQACTSVAISGLPAAPALPGTQVTFTASASGCPNPSYAFWMRPASSSSWQLIQGYSTGNQFHWNSTGAAPGIVYFGVWARDASSSTATFDANASIPYAVGGASCGSVTVSASPQTAAHGAGARVTFTGVASGCTNPSPLYEFWFYNGSGWQVVQSWSTTSSWTWNTTGAPAGSWTFVVWVRDAASPGTTSSWLGRYDGYAVSRYTLS